MLFLPSLVLTLQPDSDVYACTMNNEVIRSRNVETGYNSVLTTKVRYQTRLNLLTKFFFFLNHFELLVGQNRFCLFVFFFFVCIFLIFLLLILSSC